MCNFSLLFMYLRFSYTKFSMFPIFKFLACLKYYIIAVLDSKQIQDIY